MSAVFLDLDGTLTDPKQGITRSIVFALQHLGIPAPDAETLTWAIGPALVDSFAKLGVSDPDQALALYRHRFADVGLFENKIYAGVVPMLRCLKLAGHDLYIATAKPHVYARRITEHFNINEFMTAEFGPELDGTRNNKADLLAYALEQTGVVPQHAVMVGDRYHDSDAAHAVGMASVAVTWGYGNPSEWARADHICHTPASLPDAIRHALEAAGAEPLNKQL